MYLWKTCASNPKTEDGLTKLALGKSSITLDKFLLQWKENIDYNVKLNELVNLVTNLQIGAFINPTGTIAPSKIEVSKLRFDTQTGEVDKFINSEGRFQFESLTYGEDKYGPLDINVAAQHLDAASLLALKNKIAEVSMKKMSGRRNSGFLDSDGQKTRLRACLPTIRF